MPVETAMQRLRRLAGLPPANDVTAVKKKPVFRPHIDPLPEDAGQKSLSEKEETRALGATLNQRERNWSQKPVPHKTEPREAVPSRPSQIVAAANDPFAPGRAASDAGGKPSWKPKSTEILEPHNQFDSHDRSISGILSGAGRTASTFLEPRKPLGPREWQSRDEVSGGDEADPDLLRGMQEKVERKATYSESPEEKRRLLSVGAKIGAETQFVRDRPSITRQAVADFTRTATFGASGYVDHNDDWDREKQARIAAKENLTPDDLRNSGVIGMDDKVPRLTGNEEEGTMTSPTLRSGARMIGGIVGFASPMGIESKLIGGALRSADAAHIAGAARRGAEGLSGLSRVEGVAKEIGGVSRKLPGFVSPNTLTGKVAKSMGEFAVPGAALAGTEAHRNGENVGDAIAADMVTGTVMMGAGFPVAGKLFHEAMAVGKRAMAAGRPAMAKLAQIATSGRVTEPSQIDLAPQPKVPSPIDDVARPAFEHLKTFASTRAGKAAIIAGGAAAAAKYGQSTESEEDKQANKERMQKYGMGAIAAAGTLVTHGAHGAEELGHTWEHKGWKIQKNALDKFDVYNPDNIHISSHPTFDKARWDGIGGTPPASLQWTVKQSGGLYDLHDDKGKYVKSFASSDEAVAHGKKTGHAVTYAPEDKKKPSPRVRMGLLGRTVKEQAWRLRNLGMHDHADNLEKHMEGSSLEHPLVHASRTDFPAFKFGELGFHMAVDPAAAEKRLPWYSTTSSVGKLNALWANIKNPIRLTDPGEWNQNVLHELHAKGVITDAEQQATANAILELMTNERGPKDEARSSRSYRWMKPVRDLLKSKGHDGIVYENKFEGGGDSYIAFDPEQLKSATGNSGAFDPKVAAIAGGALIGARLLDKSAGPATEDEKKHAKMLGAMAMAMGTLITRREAGPGLHGVLEGRLEDLTHEFRELHENYGPAAQKAAERIAGENKAKEPGFEMFYRAGRQGLKSDSERTPFGRKQARAAEKERIGEAHAAQDRSWRSDRIVKQMMAEYKARGRELVAKARDLQTRIEEAKNALPPEELGYIKKGAIGVGATTGALAANKYADEDTKKVAGIGALAAGALVTRGHGAGEIAEIAARRAELSAKLKAFHAEKIPRTPKELQTATQWALEGKELKKRQAELEAAQPKQEGERKIKPANAVAFFSRADKLFDEGGLDKHIANRPTKNGVPMRGKTPSAAAEWKEMLLDETIPNVSQKELQIRLGEQLDIAAEEGRTLTKDDVRGMLADNPIKIQVHVVGKPVGEVPNNSLAAEIAKLEAKKAASYKEGGEHFSWEENERLSEARSELDQSGPIEIAGGQIENAANYNGSGALDESPFEDWTFKGGDDYRSLVITAEPTKRYRPENNPKRPYDVILERNPDRGTWSVLDPSTRDTMDSPDGHQMFDIPSKAEAERRAGQALRNDGWTGDRINSLAIEEGDPVPTQHAKTPADLILKRSADGEGWDTYYPNGEQLPATVSGASREDAAYYARKWWREQGHEGSPTFGDESGMVGAPKYEEAHYGKGGWIQGGGWDNVIAHVRIKTRMIDGKKTLHIEEAQSSLGQTIAKYGADGSPERKAKIKETKARLKEIDAEIKELMRGVPEPTANTDRKALTRRIKALAAEIIDPNTSRARAAELKTEREGLIKQRGDMNPQEQGAQHEAVQKLKAEQRKLMGFNGELAEKNQERNTPALPLAGDVGEYTDVMLRTALDVAAREGHERIVWTGGLDQTHRFDGEMSKVVDKILYDPSSQKVVATYEGKPVEKIPTSMSPRDLHAYFGSYVAEHLIAGAEKESVNGATFHKVAGKDISVGKKGMVNYYDNVIPAWFEKEARRLGIEIELKESTIEDAHRKVGASDLAIGTAESPVDFDRDEYEYRLDQARHDGSPPSVIASGRRVLHYMDGGDSFADAVQKLTPEKRGFLAEALGEDTYSPSGGSDVKSAKVTGFDVPHELVNSIFAGNYAYSNPMFDPAALKALAKAHPTIFHGALLGATGYGVRAWGDDTDNEKIKWTGMGIMALGGLHAVGAHPYKGETFAGNKLAAVGAKIRDGIKDEKFGNKKGRDILNWISHDILATPELKQAAKDFEAGVAKGAARAAEFQAKMRALGPIGERLAADFIDQEAWEKEAAKLSPEELKAVLLASQALIDEFHDIGTQEVAEGTMSKGQFLTHDGKYIPRLYPGHEADAARGVNTEPGGNRPTLQKHSSRDPNLTQAERTAMGQIRETGYLASRGIAKGYRNIAAAKLFSALSGMKGVIEPSYQAAVQDVLNATKSGNTAHIEATKKALEHIQHDMKGGYGEYKTLSTSKGYGVLAGAVVRKDVADYLEGLPNMGTSSLANNLFQSWKKIHTVFNPGTHVGNFVSNITTVHMKGLPIHQIPGAISGAWDAIKAYDRDVRDLTEAGVMDNNVATMNYGSNVASARTKLQTLRDLADRTTPKTRKLLAEKEIEPNTRFGKVVMGHGGMPGEGKWFEPGQVKTAAEKAYNLEDNLFRVALYKKVIMPEAQGGMGLTRAQGIEYTRHHMGDFKSRSGALALARWYSPFIMYPAKMLPHMVGSVVTHPWRWLTLAAGWGAIDQLSAYSQGNGDWTDVQKRIKSGRIDPMDMKEDERPSRGFGYLIPGPIQAPIKIGRAKFAEDISRFTPFSSVSGAPSPGSMVAALSDRIPAVVSPGGPLASLFARTQVNADPYTGERMINAGESPLSKAGKVFGGIVADQVLPSALSWHAPRFTHDVRDKSWQKAGVDALGFAGMRPRTIVPGQRAKQDRFWLQDENEAASRELGKRRRETRDPGRLKDALEEYRDRKKRIAAEFKRRNTRQK